MQNKRINPVNAILDPENHDNIFLYNEKDEPVEFEQVALIPLGDRVFVILKPIIVPEGTDEDEAFVFEIIEDKSTGGTFNLITDDMLIDKVFEVYYSLF